MVIVLSSLYPTAAVLMAVPTAGVYAPVSFSMIPQKYVCWLFYFFISVGLSIIYTRHCSMFPCFLPPPFREFFFSTLCIGGKRKPALLRHRGNVICHGCFVVFCVVPVYSLQQAFSFSVVCLLSGVRWGGDRGLLLIASALTRGFVLPSVGGHCA